MSSLPVTIRRFRPQDFGQLLQMDRICFPADIAFLKDEMACYLSHPKSITHIAETSAGIVGFILAKTEGAASAHVLTLDVLPEARQRNVGTALMSSFHQEIGRKGIRVSVLEVSVENTPAQRLYQKLQYTCIETLRGYYRGTEDAYRMVRVDDCSVYQDMEPFRIL